MYTSISLARMASASGRGSGSTQPCGSVRKNWTTSALRSTAAARGSAESRWAPIRMRPSLRRATDNTVTAGMALRWFAQILPIRRRQRPARSLTGSMWMATESSRPGRWAAVCTAGMLAVGRALVAGPAYADAPTVTFSGGSVVGMLVCRSQPSAAQVAVAAETRVLFVNRLGQPATLRVGAQTVAKVGANQAVPVLFHYGPVPVSMAIPCSVGVVEQFESVTVGVSRPAST